MKKIFLFISLLLPILITAQTTTGPLGPNVVVDSSGNLQVGTQIGAKVINGIAYSHKYTGATLDVRVNACLVDAAAGTNGAISHICSSEGEGVAQTIAAQINVGNVAQDKVTWKLPSSCLWDAIMTGGTSYAIKQWSRSNIVGPAPLLSCEFRNLSTSNGIAGMYTNAGGGYYRASGFVLESKNVPVTSNAVMSIPGGFDATVYENIEVLSYITNTTGILIGNTGGPCCSVTFKGVTINNNSTGGIPLKIVGNGSGLTNGIYFIDSSIDHPAAGQPNISISNTGSTTIPVVVGFSGLYEETHDSTSGGPDTTTVPNQLSGLMQVFFNGIEVKSFSANSVAPIFSLSGAQPISFSLRDLSTPIGFTEPAVAVQNNLTSTACPAPPCNINTDSKGNRNSYETNDTWGDNFAALGRVRSAWYVGIEQSSAPSGIAGQGVSYFKTSDHRPYVKLNNGGELGYVLSDQTIGIPGAVNITPATATNPSAETTLQEVALSANYFNSLNQPFTVTAAGKHTNAGAQTPTYTYKAKLCTVSGCGSGTVVTLFTATTGNSTASTTNNPWAIVLNMTTNAIGASGTLISTGNLFDDISALTTDAQNTYQYPNTATSAIDLTAALFLDFTITNSTSNASNTVTQSSAIVVPQSNVANAGIVASAPFFNGTPQTGTAVTATTDKALLIGFYLPYQVTFSNITYRTVAADNTANAYDIGVYTTAGVLACDIGATAGTTFAPTTNTNITRPCAQGTVTLPAGKYYYAFTGNANTATISGTSISWTYKINTGALVTSGGQLATPVVPGADAWTTTTIPALVLN